MRLILKGFPGKLNLGGGGVESCQLFFLLQSRLEFRSVIADKKLWASHFEQKFLGMRTERL